MKTKFLFLIFCFACANSAFGEDYRYASDEKIGGQPWFIMKRSNVTEGDTQRYEIVFAKPDDSVKFVTEQVVLAADDELKKYDWIQLQTGQEFRSIVNGNTIEYEWKSSKSAKSEKSTIHLSDAQKAGLVAPPLLADHVKKHWAEFEKNRRLDFWLFVPDRQDIFRFYFEATDDLNDKTRPHALKLEATSMVVALVAPKIKFLIEEVGSSKVLRAVLGFAPPVRWQDSSGRLVEKKTNIRLIEDSNASK